MGVSVTIELDDETVHAVHVSDKDPRTIAQLGAGLRIISAVLDALPRPIQVGDKVRRSGFTVLDQKAVWEVVDVKGVQVAMWDDEQQVYGVSRIERVERVS